MSAVVTTLFKSLFDGCENAGFPRAAIPDDGTLYTEKEAHTG